MDLASFESREEFLKIRPKLSAEIRDKPVIVGGFLHGDEYRWMSSGLKIDFRYDPSKGKNCLGLQKEGAIGYVPLTCNEEYLFICQKLEFHYSN
ncbi:hypothetical protein PVAND_010572 [Polypedilum vanderplanki]|nr:hypothetical protein PVAND_010572 [Polypedilum vanderplanki]